MNKIKQTETAKLNQNDSLLLKSLHQDLVKFQQEEFLMPDVKIGLGIAIEQLERYMRGELDVHHSLTKVGNN
jgi:hypothetical protein